MNANYLYEIFETTEKHDAPDLHIGFAMLKVEKDIPVGMTEKGIKSFLANHYSTLVAAYKEHDRDVFAKAVEDCETKDATAQELRV